MTNEEIFKQFTDTIIPELQKVSGRFASSIESEYTDDTLTISASPFIRVLIDGRKPTSANARTGSPTLQQIIRKWIDEKGITPKAKKNGIIPTKEQLSWAISKSIHVNGTLLWQRGGGNNIFDPILTPQRINYLLNLLANQYYVSIENIVTNVSSSN
jgi:hypothetical protein